MTSGNGAKACVRTSKKKRVPGAPRIVHALDYDGNIFHFEIIDWPANLLDVSILRRIPVQGQQFPECRFLNLPKVGSCSAINESTPVHIVSASISALVDLNHEYFFSVLTGRITMMNATHIHCSICTHRGDSGAALVLTCDTTQVIGIHFEGLNDMPVGTKLPTTALVSLRLDLASILNKVADVVAGVP